MLFGITTLLTALGMAVVAAWFAIAGIMAVFAGAPIAALIMGIVIESGKIVGVSWIYQNIKEKTKIKYILAPLVIMAMLLTSMGIFGFLSKAHLDQITPVGNNSAKIERLDQRVDREQSKIADAEIIIAQLDETVQVLIDFNKISHPTEGARVVRAGQQDQRDVLANTIDAAEDNISEYEDEKFVLSSELRELELEVGPVKYIAELIYTDAEDRLEEAVRFVIIAFIFVFDPMAVVLLMAANYTLMGFRKKRVINNDNLADIPGGDLIELIDDETSTNNHNELTEDDIRAILSVDSDVVDNALENPNNRREPTQEELQTQSALRQFAARREVDEESRARGKPGKKKKVHRP